MSAVGSCDRACDYTQVEKSLASETTVKHHATIAMDEGLPEASWVSITVFPTNWSQVSRSLAHTTSVFQNRGLVFVLYLSGTIPQESWGTISADWSAIAV